MISVYIVAPYSDMQIGGLGTLVQLVRPLVSRRSVSFRVNVWLVGAQVWFPCHVFKMSSDVTSGVVKLGVQNLLSMMSAASIVAPSGIVYRSRRTWEHKRGDHGAQDSVVIHACQFLDRIFITLRFLVKPVFFLMFVAGRLVLRSRGIKLGV